MYLVEEGLLLHTLWHNNDGLMAWGEKTLQDLADPVVQEQKRAKKLEEPAERGLHEILAA